MPSLRAFAVAALTLAAVLASAQGNPYSINRFDVDIELKQDATITVSERIEVTFNEPRRGIFRTIPIVYPASGGRKRAIQLRVTDVVDGSGNRLTKMIKRESDGILIRIGDADVWLDPGTTMVYVIRYRVFGALNWQEDSTWEPWTELYWNVTGDQWDTQIATCSFNVTFPESGDGAQIRGRVYTGSYGSEASAYLDQPGETGSDNPALTSLSLSDGSFLGARLAALSPYEGLTLVLGVPQTSVPRPPPWVEFFWRANEYLPLLTPLVVLLVMLPIWWKHGRDTGDGPTQVRFEPPSSLPAPEAGTMMDERVDQRDLAAGIMSLCVKGYFNVEVVQKEGLLKSREYELHPTGKTDTTGLSRFEIELYGYLESCGDKVTKDDLRDFVAPHVGHLRQTVYNDFVDRGLYRANPENVRTAAIIGGIVLSGIAAFILLQFSLAGEVWVAAVGGLLGLFPAISFGWHMPRRTLYGTRVRRETLGFYEMMRHRKNYMAWVVEKQPDGLKYEEYLPYAVAFDCVEQWNDAFKDIVREPPRWYHDPYGGVFYPHVFVHDLRSMTTDFGHAAATPPRSSGASGGGSGFSSFSGGGGGFSGGGFGGGGGGSW